MGTTTTNYALYKPSLGELGWTTQLNGNFDTIDAAMTWLSSDRFSVKDTSFAGGAVGDGLTDDTAAIQATIDAAAADGGGVVFLPQGTYLVTSSLVLASDITMAGVGPDASIIKQADGTNMGTRILDLNGVNDVTVRDLQIDGNRFNNTGHAHAINIRGNSFRNTVVHVSIFRSTGDGVSISGTPATYCQVEECHIEDGAWGAIIMVGRDDAGTWCDYIRVRGNTIKGTANHAILASGGSSLVIEGNIITDAGVNWLEGFSHAIAIDGGSDTHPSSYITVSNNVITNAYMAGIEIADQVHHVAVTGNIVNGTVNSYGIFFGGGLFPCYAGTIAGNVVTGCDQEGIRSGGSGPSTRTTGVTIAGNTVSGCGSHGIFVDDLSHFSIVGNVCFNNDMAETDHEGIRLGGVSDGLVMGNRCYDNQDTQTQNWGLHIQGTADDVVISGNDFQDNVFGAISDTSLAALSGKSVLRDNMGFNPQGTEEITVTSNPFLYTNEDFVPEAIYLTGGDVYNVSKDTVTIAGATPMTVWLEPGEGFGFTYTSVAPLMVKDRK